MEKYYEDLLNIKTCGEQDWSEMPNHYHPYQATLYKALDILSKEYTLKNSDYVIDFGCGKGRLAFYLNYFYDCNVIGVEMNEEFYQKALLNKESYLEKYNININKIDFNHCFAQEFKINKMHNKFYFFNPFSLQIFRKIIYNILDSFQDYNRDIQLILYYPSDEYIYYIESLGLFNLYKEIIIDDLYVNDNKEKFLIYNIIFY